MAGYGHNDECIYLVLYICSKFQMLFTYIARYGTRRLYTVRCRHCIFWKDPPSMSPESAPSTCHLPSVIAGYSIHGRPVARGEQIT